jgi:hypothetical protein
VVDQAYDRPEHVTRMHGAAERCRSLGRTWEARAWARLALEIQPDAAWARELFVHRPSQLPDDVSRTASSVNSTFQVDLSHYPLPRWDGLVVPGGTAAESEAVSIAFSDDATSAGLDGYQASNQRQLVFGFRPARTN